MNLSRFKALSRQALGENKFYTFCQACFYSSFQFTAPFVRIIPTDACNLNCSYCWQRKDNSYVMTMGEFEKILAKAVELHCGFITFLGGEPMIWPHLYQAISECSKANITTDITTNGTLLTDLSIHKLALAGLNYLNISVDGVKENIVTHKNSIFQPGILAALKCERKENNLHFRINAVIYKNNFEEIKLLLEYAHDNDVQISLGYVVPNIEEKSTGADIHFTKDDFDLLTNIVDYILLKKTEGYPIIDPDDYFKGIFKFINHKKFWNCNYPTRYGWINVSPNGYIRSCTKKMDTLDYHFCDLNSEKIEQLKNLLNEKTQLCNLYCYSNCAYNSFYYTHNKFALLKKITDRFKPKG